MQIELFAPPAEDPDEMALYPSLREPMEQAYSCDRFPDIRPPVNIGGALYTVSALHFKDGDMTAFFHRMIQSADYSGPDKVEYSAQGKVVQHKGIAYKLGKKIRAHFNAELSVPSRKPE